MRGSDVFARFGGDEFVALQYPLAELDESAALAEQIVGCWATPCRTMHTKSSSTPASELPWRRVTATAPTCS
jgi:hypothetical protein